MDIFNSTLFNTAVFFLMDRSGMEACLIVVKGTWQMDDTGKLTVADEQMPILCEPVYTGAVGASSLLYDHDVVLEKPGTDCVLIGHAWAPKAGVSSVDVTFGVGPVRKMVRVFGERVWLKCLGLLSMSKPAPFEKVPLVYERAFGGFDTSWPDRNYHEVCLENPVGRGFIAAKSKLARHGMRLPNLEDPRRLIKRPTDRPPTAAFGMVPPQWLPRRAHAGSYHEEWRGEVMPLAPAEQDVRFNSAAAAGLATSGHLKGDEQVLVEGASRRGRLLFNLPGVKPRVTVRLRKSEEELAMRLDGVVVEPDAKRVVLTWRGTMKVQGRVHDLLGALIS